MEWSVFLRYLFVMAGVTYLVRMLPLVLMRKPIKSPFIKSFLYYVPYAVLAAMTIPDIFYSTSSVWSAVAGFVVAVVFALLGLGLLPVALAACIAVFIAERFL